MDSQSSQSSPIQHQKMSIVAQQILKAFNSEAQNDSNIVIFLSKLYKNNCSLKTKKMKSIRLNRFICLLEHVLDNFPSTKTDVELLYQSVVSALSNDKNFSDEEDYQLVEAMGLEIAKVIEKLSEGEFGFLAVKLLSHLVNGQSLISSMIEVTEFEENLKKSTYFPNVNLSNLQPSLHHSNHEHQWRILEQTPIATIILEQIRVQKVYSGLFKSSQDKSRIVSLFYDHLQKLHRAGQKSRKEQFMQCFISSQEKLSVNEAEAILKILQKPLFDRETINEVVNLIAHQKLSLEQLMEIDFKKIKGIEEVFVQSLLQQTSKKTINQIISLFLSMKSEQNYFPMYLILKLNKKVPLQLIGLFFQDTQLFTVRRAIILVLAIVDNGVTAFDALLRVFLDWNQTERVRTRKQYQCVLKAVHFSLQNVSKANVISQILRSINKLNLNSQSCLQFLGYSIPNILTHQEMKPILTSTNRQALSILFKTLNDFDQMTKTKNTTELSPIESKQLQLQRRYRLDLQSILNSNPLIQQQIMSSIKELNKILDGSVGLEELLKQLPSTKENLLEVILMWVNNKYDTFYLEEVNPQTIDWALKMYKKYTNDLNVELKSLMEREKLDNYFKLIKTLVEFNMQRRSQLKFSTEPTKVFTPQVQQLINSCTSKQQRLNSTNFNDYFLTCSKWKKYISLQNSSQKSIQKTYRKIIWIKALLIQIKELVRNMIKAEKVGNRKELKNVIAEHVSDVLAFKIVHQYFDSQVEEGRQVLLEVLRTIYPQMQFFQRTEALASSLNIEFYSIFDELPQLLQNFNSETLIFLSKLITSPKTAEDKKKITRKKKEKDVNEEDSICINSIVKNFHLLFGDPNSMQSFKSLFMILRKLVDCEKVNKEELQRELNKWLLEINFLPCSSFQTWKNKVLSLSKMWKTAAELLGDKKIEKRFQVSVLQKHFHLFTDLLNKLYENFRHQAQFLQLQQRILLSLCLIYKKQDFSHIIEEQKNMTTFIIKRFQQRNMSRITLDNKFYYCQECKKNACYACSSFLHRNHDKIYIGKTGSCEHQTVVGTNLKAKKQAMLKSQYAASIYGGVSAILKKNDDLPQEVLQRISQKLLLDERLGANDDGEFLGRFRDSQMMRELFQSRLSKNKSERTQEIRKKLKEKEAFLKGQFKKEDVKQIEENQKTISPQAEDYFHYREPYCKEFKKIHSQIASTPPKFNVTIPQINVSPLARVFLRELQHQHFYNEQSSQKQENTSIQSVTIEELKEKFLFFKNNNLRPDNSRDYALGRGRGGYGGGGFTYGQNPRENQQSLQTRNTIACNKKYLMLPSSLSLMNLSLSKIHEKLSKRIETKEYSQVEQEKNYACTPPVGMQFDVLETSLSSSSSNPVVAAVGNNQLCFYSINADGRFGRQINPQFGRMDNITKFTWINDKKNLFAIAFSNYIRIGGISSSSNIKAFSKAQIGKPIRDFDGYMNSKMYILFILDNDGKLYFVDVDFKEGKNAAYNSSDKMILLKDQQGNAVKDEIYSVKNVDGNRLLLSSPNGIVRIVQVNRESNAWTTRAFDLRKTMKLDAMIVLQTIKIIKHDEQTITFSALGRKLNAFENAKVRKFSGQLMLITLNTQTHSFSSILYTREQNIESYDFTFINPGQLLITTLNDEGAVNFMRHAIDVEPKQIVERINVPMDNVSLRAFCKKLLNVDFFTKVEQGAMLKNLQFKENKVLTGGFGINVKKQQITVKQSSACTHFITGLSLQVQLPASVTDYSQQQGQRQVQKIVTIKLQLLESSYTFNCTSKIREIQLPLNIKETIQLFAHQNQTKISVKIQLNEQIMAREKFTEKELQEFVKIKNVQVYGYEAKDLTIQGVSPYHTALRELYNDWCTYQQYHNEGFEEYLLNYYRHDFHNIDIKRLYKLKYDNSNQGTGFKPNEINLFLKLELFSQTLVPSLMNDIQTNKDNIEEYLKFVKKELLSKDYKRKSLENSVFRLCQTLCYVYEKKTEVTVGHPYYRETLINLHNFTVFYQKWEQKKNLLTFDKLCKQLSNLIFTQAIDLHLILQSFPELIIELSTFFKRLISERKHKQLSQEQSETSITGTCSRYIAILCEYYQVLKNKAIPNTQEKLLFLLQQVFGQSKHDMPKQLVMNPFLYLESIFNLSQQSEVNSIIDIFAVQGNNMDLLSEGSFDLEKTTMKKGSSNEVKQQQQAQIKEQQRLMGNHWSLIEEEKQMQEEENQMYMAMEMEEDFDDEDGMVMEEVENIELEIKKQKSLLKDPQMHQQLPSLHKNLDQTITNAILSHRLPQAKRVTINNYDFPFQLAIELFRRQNYLTQSNVYFYLGLLYNLLKIIENNMRIRQNKNKIEQFIQAVDNRLQNKEYSSLFIVLNFFVCPRYNKTQSAVTMRKPESGLSEHFAAYYKKHNERFAQLLTNYNPTTFSAVTKLSQIMRYTPFQLHNQLYNLRFLSNIYLTFRLLNNNFPQVQQNLKIKEELLFKLVKYRLPAIKNIMLFEKWEQQLDRAKVLVGFEIITATNKKSEDKEEGVNMLYRCAKDQPQKFIQELIEDPEKVSFLEEYSLQSLGLTENTQTKIFELLEIYYKS